jgi:hypothetical protein
MPCFVCPARLAGPPSAPGGPKVTEISCSEIAVSPNDDEIHAPRRELIQLSDGDHCIKLACSAPLSLDGLVYVTTNHEWNQDRVMCENCAPGNQEMDR